MKSNNITLLRWLKMTTIKNCYKKNNCICADNSRKILLKLPITENDVEIIKNETIKILKKYYKCFNANK
jgi:hypothetical protein